MNKHLKLLLLISLSLLIFISVSSAPALAQKLSPGPVASGGELSPNSIDFNANNNGKVIVIIADRTSIDDWARINAPNLDALCSRFSIGLMNCDTGGKDIADNTNLTIGSGVPLCAPETASSAYMSDKLLNNVKARNIYKQRTGKSPPDNSILQLDIAKIYNLNKDSSYTLGPGTLGTKLNEHGIKTAVLGNSDSLLGLQRPAVSMAMNNEGIVSNGSIEKSILLKNNEFPGGAVTNYNKILKKLNSLSNDTRFIVIDTGDFSRIEDARDNVLKIIIPEYREKAFQRLDNFLGRLLKHINLNKDTLAIISPTAKGNTVNGENLLTPVLLAGNGIENGLIYSPATKRPGIIRNTDFLPFIFKFFNIKSPPGVTGQPFKVMPGNYSIDALVNLQSDLVFNHSWRRPVLQNYILLQLVLLIVSLTYIFWKKPLSYFILYPLILAVMSVPLVLLILPLIQVCSPVIFLGEIFCLIFIITVISILTRRWGNFAPILFISAITSLVLIIDLLLGAPLQKCSLFGYDPIVGARFYGLGNEYMGVLIGSTIIAATSLITIVHRYKRAILTLIGLYFALVIYVIAAPGIGTNVGGTISSTGAFLASMLLLLDIKITPRIIAYIGAGIICVVLSFIFFDISRPAAQQSHIGRVASLISSGGIETAFNIISRKIAINIKLIKYTIWSRIFIGSLACLVILFYRPVGTMEFIHKKYPYLFKGIAGIITGSVLALVFNDSGIVAAATAMIFGANPLIYIILQEHIVLNKT
ncbi:MAG: hypothetical protein K9L17_04300 [Clostridiales bacterium]|nr:hypothetical protein [Clostridiales bacterium]MCF8021901.1 hypothetical protein [Clostridiales bacterium]